jgi:tetratricopeptide (TPR) repeat protein/predicted Ser/Thr protein kinase
MDSNRWERIQSLFHEAAELPASQRQSFLDAATGGDDPLIKEVLAMLEEDQQGASLLDREVGEVAGHMLHQPLPAQEFGPYRIKELLGEGGMGVVYLGEREDLGSPAAIKILRDAWMSPARRERFAAEQRTLAQLVHRSIARLYDADTLEDGTPWFAMEYVKGIPLTEYCVRHKTTLEQRLKLLRSVCEAVQYAHSRAVIHRDLKPSNILVQEDGTVKLLDFGIAKHLDQQETPEDRTRTLLRMMTPAYGAPEQKRGEPAGVYSDVYSLGVILYEMLTGRLPLEGAPEKPSRSPAPALRASRSNWADLDVLCLTAIRHEPERRYRSAEALIRDIDHYLAGEPLEARGDPFGYRLGKFLTRNSRPVAAAAIVFAAIVSLIVFYTVRLASARNEAVAAAARTERVLRFTLNLFRGGDKEAGPAKELRVTTLIDRGIAEAAGLGAEPRMQAELFETLGQVSQTLGNHDQADTLLTSSLQRRKALFGSSHPSVAASLVKLGLLRAEQAKLEVAEQLVREGLDMARRTLPEGHPDIAGSTHALGKVLVARGRYDQAIQLLGEAVGLRSRPGSDQAELADSLLELANAHFYAGHFAQSESLNRRLLDMHRKLYGPRHPLVAEDLINLGAIQQETGNYREAESFHRQALEINQAFHGEDHYKTASSLTLVARALLFQKRYQETAELLDRSLAIQERVFGKAHPRVASALNELGTVALMRERFDEAEQAFRRVVDIYRSVHAGKHYLIGVGLANLASTYMARKQNSRAESLFREALAMYAQTLPPGNNNVGITRIKLGRSLLRQNRFAEAETESLAGYQILSSQASPSVSWLHSARQDLAAIYTALNQPEKAKPFLAEESAIAKK